MRSGFAVMLMIAVIFGTGYWFFEAAAICKVPISYRVGSIDPEFSVSFTEAKAAAATAESIWEDATGRNLFTYDEKANVSINFVYDERQAKTNEEERLRDQLENTENLSDSVKAKYEELLEEYNDLKSEYEARRAEYERELDAHNREVERWNRAGGAPQDIYINLQARQEALAAEQEKLNNIAYQLNQLVRQMNAIGAQGNSIIEDYNEIVEEYNDRFAEHTEFTQGDYQNRSINIYQFESLEDLEIVLAHEFGHSLSLGHVGGSESIMYYLMGDQSLETGATAEDLTEFEKICGDTSFVGTIARYFPI